jgi:hypothetical protein
MRRSDVRAEIGSGYIRLYVWGVTAEAFSSVVEVVLYLITFLQDGIDWQ